MPFYACRRSRGGLYAVHVLQPPPLVSRSGRRRSGWNSCQPVSDFVTFGLIQPVSYRKSKKIGLKAARIENKKPLEIFLSLKNVMKRKKPAEKNKTRTGVNKKALPKSSDKTNRRKSRSASEKPSISGPEKIF